MSQPAAAPGPEKPTTYDETPYPSAAFPQSHPNRLAAMGRLFGLATKSPSSARVLEIGAADGANLLPMAEQAPESSFVGIDASQVQVDTGRKAIAAAELKNVELRVQNILDFPASEGKFDYIIAHGIYSWVPEPVRQKILAICQEHLTENGIAYISYNALPGWNMRQSLRDMMLFHTHGIADPKAKVRQARALLKFLADSVPTENNAYGMLLKSELELFGKSADSYFRHDILEEDNKAFYFHEFCARAHQHQLQYLSEPNLAQMLAANFPENVSKTLLQVSNNIIAQEQYMDFVRNRFFRQTLLCRRGIPIQRNVSSDKIRQLAIVPALKPRTGPVDLARGVAATFESLGGHKLNTSDSFLKAVMEVLTETNARALAYGELLERARARFRPLVTKLADNQDAIEDTALANNLFTLFSKGLLDVVAEPVAIATVVPEKPRLSPLMRHQAGHALYVTSRVHQPITLDAAMRRLAEACDGTRDRDELLRAMVQSVLDGKLHLTDSGKPVTEVSKLRSLLAPRMEGLLANLARAGLLAP